MRINEVIKKPIVTEKSMADAAKSRYHFSVNTKASKGSIAKEIENLFGVNVVSVKTLLMPGKQKRMLKVAKYTKTLKWKKAIIQLKEGEKINLIEETN